jgi:hypothetical protein
LGEGSAETEVAKGAVSPLIKYKKYNKIACEYSGVVYYVVFGVWKSRVGLNSNHSDNSGKKITSFNFGLG